MILLGVLLLILIAIPIAIIAGVIALIKAAGRIKHYDVVAPTLTIADAT